MPKGIGYKSKHTGRMNNRFMKRRSRRISKYFTSSGMLRKYANKRKK